MTRTEQLRTCRKCNHINFSVKKGFICSVTYDYANFENNCNDFQQATFISNKKVLKPADLTVVEIVKNKANNKNVRKIFGVLILGILGLMMIEDPNLFSSNQHEITNSIARKVMNVIWGIPSGLLALGVGFLLAFQIISKKSANR